MNPAKTAEPIKMSFGMWTYESARRGLSHENYFRLGFTLAMWPFVKFI